MGYIDLLRYWPEFLRGLGMSVLVTMIGMVVGSALGLLIYLADASPRRIVRLPARGYIELFRNTPLLVQLYLIYFGLPSIGVDFSAFNATIIALIVNSAAYMAEIFRAGFATAPRGQREAAAALGLNRRETFRYVLLTPAIRRALPAVNNQLILVFLFSSIAALISLNELMNVVLNLGLQTALRVETLVIGGVLYYLASALCTALIKLADRKLFRW